MRKILLSILLLTYINSFSQEKIYGDFQLFQSKKEVKKIFKANKDKYQNISFGGLDFWIINKLAISSFIYENGKLNARGSHVSPASLDSLWLWDSAF